MKKIYANVKIDMIFCLDPIKTSGGTTSGTVEVKQTDDWTE